MVDFECYSEIGHCIVQNWWEDWIDYWEIGYDDSFGFYWLFAVVIDSLTEEGLGNIAFWRCDK